MATIDRNIAPIKQEVENFLKQIDFKLPEGFIEFFKDSNGADISSDENYIVLWALTEMIQLNIDYKAHPKNKIHFKLIDTLGNVVRERTRKIKPEPQNFVSFRNTDFDIYVLVNRFFTETICFALDNHGDLVVPSESTVGGFLILFPLAGALNHDAYTYCRVDTVAN
jgi:hypothetical protein